MWSQPLILWFSVRHSAETNLLAVVFCATLVKSLQKSLYDDKKLCHREHILDQELSQEIGANNQMDLFVVDGSAPFFAPIVDGSRQNWSKAPLGTLLRSGRIEHTHAEQICHNLELYCQRVVDLGYNAITFDDLPHLICFDFYPAELKRVVESCRQLFRRAFKIATSARLKIFITTDLMFWNDTIARQVAGGDSEASLRALFSQALEQLYQLFPDVDGVVVRIGEADGNDVESHFKSRLHIRSARQCNRWLKEILPVCEQWDKTLIFRTWGLGAYPIGDLIWNRRTEAKAFAGINSEHFVVSRKYGSADFFRYLPLNERILQSHHNQIIELQARREYEGFGVFPAYAGRQYQAYRDQLKDCPTLRGISVWCQTGGWSHFDRLTFLDDSSPWNELNTVAAVELFRYGRNADDILKRFCQERFSDSDSKKLVEIVSLFDSLIDQLWYFAPFARRPIWFRRLQVPPLLWIFWDTIIVNRALRLVFRTYIDATDKLKKRDKGQREHIRRLRKLVTAVDVEQEGLTLGVDTFRMLYTLRRFYIGKGGTGRERKIRARMEKYHHRYPAGFQVECDFTPVRLRWITSGALFGILMRHHSGYRIFDRLVLVPVSGWIFPLIMRWQKHRIPDLAERQALGLELFFR